MTGTKANVYLIKKTRLINKIKQNTNKLALEIILFKSYFFLDIISIKSMESVIINSQVHVVGLIATHKS